MLAIILARVSSQEQEEGHSIAAQKRRLQEYCERQRLNVIRTCEIVESSTRGDRREFHEMIAFAKAQTERVAIVADAVDRVQRSFKESVLLDDLRRSGRVEVHFLRENLVLNEDTPSDRLLMWDFATIAAKAYVAALSENVRRSLTFKRQNGEWTSRAPIGYRNTTDEASGKRTIVVDPQRAPYVTRAFKLYSTGSYSVSGLARLLREEGLTNDLPPYNPLSSSMVHRMLQNSFYFGVMKIRGKEYAHRYPPLIDEWLFWTCQGVRQRYQKQPFKYAGKRYAFRGLLRCAYCGCAISSDRKKGRYTYLTCTKSRGECPGVRVREEVVLDQVANVFRSMQVPEHVLPWIRKTLSITSTRERRYRQGSLTSLRGEYDRLQRSLDTLLDLRLQGGVSQDDYDRKVFQLKEAQLAVNVRIQNHTDGDEQFGRAVNRLLTVATMAYDIFESSEAPTKRELLNFLFSNLELRGKNLEYKLKRPFDAVLSAATHSDWLPLVNALRTDLREAVIEVNDASAHALAACGSHFDAETRRAA
jgi:DNA invertase Pin-like site-specific DNA recombinase